MAGGQEQEPEQQIGESVERFERNSGMLGMPPAIRKESMDERAQKPRHGEGGEADDEPTNGSDPAEGIRERIVVQRRVYAHVLPTP